MSSSHEFTTRPYRDILVRRSLAGAAGSNALDYTVLSVFVTTLGLILVVELVRHRIDVAATGRPFFKTVLEGVYRELATLGIVEFFIFILHKYYDDLNLQQEQVFADVHFTLFYTALFNAFQSVLMAICVSRVSIRLWVRTEQLELDHYVEIREEFERIHEILYPRTPQDEEKKRNRSSSASMRRQQSHHLEVSDEHQISDENFEDRNHENQQHRSTHDVDSVYMLDWNLWKGIKTFSGKFGRFLRYPNLNRKYNDLLIQVRFHELRVHFLRSNNLPLKLKVSDYLKRSELYVLTKLVHITTFAWLLLLGGVNLIYFLLGISVTVTEDVGTAEDALTVIFLSLNILFVVASLVIFDKMKRIFNKIIHMKLTAKDQTNTEGGEVKIGIALSESEREISSQLALFWGNDPRYVTSLIQFMQFGFTIALAILLVFWDDIAANSSSMMDGRWLLLVVFGCYVAFVAIMAHVIPRYTLCTSLGQLVNHRRLHETLARFRLEEAQRKRMEEMEEVTLGDSLDWEEDGESTPDSSDDAAACTVKAADRTFLSAIQGKQYQLPQKTGSKTMEDVNLRRRSTHFNLMADFVSSDTGELRSVLEERHPKRIASIPVNHPDERLKERRLLRKKTVSEGVTSMRAMTAGQSADREGVETTVVRVPSTDSNESNDQNEVRSMRRQRRKTQSASASIQMMRDMTPRQASAKWGLGPLPEGRPSRASNSVSNPQLLADLVMMDTKNLRGSLGLGDDEGFMARNDQRVSAREARMRERRKRRKSVSDGVALMRQVGMSEAASEVLEKTTEHAEEHGAAALRDGRSSYRERRKSHSDSDNLKQMRRGEVERPRSAEKQDWGKPSNGGDAIVVASPGAHSPSAHCTDDQDPSIGTSLAMENDGSSLDRFDSNVSDDGHSDVDDIPEMDPIFKQRQCTEPDPRPSLREVARDYFLSRKYHMVSAIFGTMVCFFVVSQRVETLLLATCVLPDTENTFHGELNVLFWSESALLVCFILISSMSIVIFAPEGRSNFRCRTRLVAGILDVLICGACFALLMIAEAQRCCDMENTRFLAEAEDKEKCSVDEGCCPTFGTRSYGGLGNIEPFTSLIALRVLRFYISKKVLLFMSPRVGMSTPTPADEQTERLHGHPVHPTFDRKEQTYEQNPSMEDEKGTVVELWKYALGLYPEIVQQHGEFSGELLQAMLGIEVLESSEKNAPLSPKTESPRKAARGENDEDRHMAFKVEKRYSTLSPDVQSIILSGKLGRSVKSSARNATVDDGTTGRVSFAAHSLQALVEAEPVDKFTDKVAPTFELGIDESIVSSTDPLSALVAPNSRLVRSMRRCDRRLPPLLDEWTVVDVVLTKHEIVYFDVGDIDNFLHSDRTAEDIARIESVYEALAATRGGKGLRLRDVAAGRKIVGHQALASIDSIHVERVVPYDFAVDNECNMSSEHLEEVHDEFWKPSYVAGRSTRTQRWQQLKEDRLKIHSHHETLYLRFYSDLEDSEASRDRCLNEREEDGPIFKNNALQWCQTCVRLCGGDQLKQKFPHYGEDSSDELRDYIQVVDSEEAEKNHGMMKKLKKKIHHRRASSSNLMALGVAAEPVTGTTTASTKAAAYRRSSSVGESDSSMTAPRPVFFHRSSSTGDLESIPGSKKGLDIV